MKSTLKWRLILSYVLVAAVSVLLISILANYFMRSQFKSYVIKNQERKNTEIITSLKQALSPKGVWNISAIQNAGVDAMQYGIIISVQDMSGNAIWDARAYNNGVCQMMISHMAENMLQYDSNFKGGYTEKVYTLNIDQKEAGIVKLGYYGPFYYTDNDILFIKTLNRIIIGVGIVSLLLAVVIGVLMAGSLSKPLVRVTESAQMISDGNYETRIHESSEVKEINDLIMDINNLAQSLQKQEELRKRLTADVAHELRTPITTLQSHMEAMIDGIWEPSVSRIESCHEEILRLKRMVGDLEQLTKYESNGVVINKTEFDLYELAGAVLNNFESEFNKKNIKHSLKGAPVNIVADRDKISQVLVNLISNSLKYSNEGGSIEIVTESTVKGIRLSVKDTGIGIAEEDLPYIFERFYRADKSRSRLNGGSGIGLTITKAIVDAHNGTIEVKSKPKVGTAVSVYLSEAF